MVPVFPRVADLKLSVLRLRPHAGVPAGLVVDVTNLLALEVPELRDAVGGQAVMLNSSGPGVVLDEAVATILLMNGAGLLVVRTLPVATFKKAVASFEEEKATTVAAGGLQSWEDVLQDALVASSEVIPESPSAVPPPRSSQAKIAKHAADFETLERGKQQLFASEDFGGLQIDAERFKQGGYFSLLSGTTAGERDRSLVNGVRSAVRKRAMRTPAADPAPSRSPVHTPLPLVLPVMLSGRSLQTTHRWSGRDRSLLGTWRFLCRSLSHGTLSLGVVNGLFSFHIFLHGS